MAEQDDPETPQQQGGKLEPLEPRAAADSSAEEIPVSMLDVHPPHESIHTWRDFFVHIATISVGLLIAIGLEQIVEHVHHLHQLDDTRRELVSERKGNLDTLNINFKVAEALKVQLENNLALIHSAQTSQISIGRGLAYLDFSHFGWPDDGPWQVAKQNGSLDLMPHGQLYDYNYLHEVISGVMEALKLLNSRMTLANSIAKRAPAGDFTPKDLEELVTATSEVEGSRLYLLQLLQFERDGLTSDFR